MDRRNALRLGALAAASTLGACAAMSGPAVQPSANLDATIQSGFMLAQTALLAISVIPGLPPIVVTEASNLLKSTQAAYAAYKAAPAGSTEAQAAIQAEIAAVNAFLATNGLPAKMAAMAGAQHAHMTVVRP